MFMPIFRFVCVLTVLAGLSIYHAGSAVAQGSDAERQACTPDAMRLCGDAIPDVARVTACMKAKSSQLSPECRAAMAGGKGGGKARTHHYRHHCRHC
jgi:hypothetical protein